MNALFRKIMRGAARLVVIAMALAALVMMTGCAGTLAPSDEEAVASQPDDDVAFLARYGEWIDVPAFHQVWRPYVTADWRPFSYGHWVWDDYDNAWAWVSYEPYGWLVYHYGNWDYEPGYGWLWIPGNDWSPARVEWMTYGDFAGWAPLPPPAVNWPDPWSGMQISVWNFVEVNNFTQENVGQYRIVKPVRAGDVSPVTVRRPPDVKTIETRSHTTVTVVKNQRETVKLRGTPRERMILPADQSAVVQKHEKETINKFLTGPKGGKAKAAKVAKVKKGSDKNMKKDVAVDKGSMDKDRKKDTNPPPDLRGKDEKKPDSTATRSKDRDKD